MAGTGRNVLQNKCRVRHAVVIEPCLRRLSPENGNIFGGGRRLSTNWPQFSRFWESGDRTLNRKSRPLAGRSATT
jgi:hypothetical protein